MLGWKFLGPLLSERCPPHPGSGQICFRQVFQRMASVYEKLHKRWAQVREQVGLSGCFSAVFSKYPLAIKHVILSRQPPGLPTSTINMKGRTSLAIMKVGNLVQNWGMTMPLPCTTRSAWQEYVLYGIEHLFFGKYSTCSTSTFVQPCRAAWS